ncbi:MAG TPA: peptide ABC transporter permease [Gammaproteobacteria bacterium]|nr:peptide ABC transporter permease [Gammaproteobacteria bacterium]HBF09919.1 peptide ABC transporter permease [Gammaproteobacteria bacterium]HCK93447.1 peptide ABC transporter permease [Gammaproteobacteria bacterium]|tara:strand:- start:436 stop:1641 length:1206 start_codon:yes stop_codon:yes gene_type:complete
MFFKIAIQSLKSRRGSVILTLLAMTISIFVLLGVEHIRHQARDSFKSTISQVDLLVGAKTGNINLLLYSIFRVGTPTSNISWKSYNRIADNPDVAWTVPISLGDSHKGFKVIGTTQDYFDFYQYGQKQHLKLSDGKPFDHLYDVVLGASVASQLGYKLGDKVILTHGLAETSFTKHKNNPFTVSGILEPTGTPVDQALHVSLQALEAIHQGHGISPDKLEPSSITAMLVGLKSRIKIFGLQRDINEDTYEPLAAVLPGVALSELWQMMSQVESVLRLISGLILFSSLLGMAAMMLSSLRERRHELKILRMLGASPFMIFRLIQLESLLITLLAMAIAAGALVGVLALLSSSLTAEYGLHLTSQILTLQSGVILGVIFVSTLIVGCIPAFSAYKSAAQIKVS